MLGIHFADKHPFSQVYDEKFEQALNDLGLDLRGVAASPGWQIDVGALRNWLRRLRGICTHPQVGKLSRHNDRLAKNVSTLKSIREVLEVRFPVCTVFPMIKVLPAGHERSELEEANG